MCSPLAGGLMGGMVANRIGLGQRGRAQDRSYDDRDRAEASVQDKLLNTSQDTNTKAKAVTESTPKINRANLNIG
mgnify:CR=1 FL=1|tara:strand:+ start:558 stop:782 length:225 start_codon:yes stop_codon:yes gene_type:complete